MPARSKAQFRFMEAAKHNPAFAKEAGISQSTAAEYTSEQGPGAYGKLPARVKPKTRAEKRYGKA